jgi:hypothetical protein
LGLDKHRAADDRGVPPYCQDSLVSRWSSYCGGGGLCGAGNGGSGLAASSSVLPGEAPPIRERRPPRCCPCACTVALAGAGGAGGRVMNCQLLSIVLFPVLGNSTLLVTGELDCAKVAFAPKNNGMTIAMLAPSLRVSPPFRWIAGYLCTGSVPRIFMEAGVASVAYPR